MEPTNGSGPKDNTHSAGLSYSIPSNTQSPLVHAVVEDDDDETFYSGGSAHSDSVTSRSPFVGLNVSTQLVNGDEEMEGLEENHLVASPSWESSLTPTTVRRRSMDATMSRLEDNILPPPVSALTPSIRRDPWVTLTWRKPRTVAFYDGVSPREVLYADDPLKISAVVCGIKILTEREADFQLSESVEGWKKALFLLTNAPYFMLAFSATLLNTVEHKAWPAWLGPLCESSWTYSILATLVASTSLALHSSQCRVGNTCCSPSRARTFHRRRVQDKLDLADCTCAGLAIAGTVGCHGFQEIGTRLALIIPVFFIALLAKKLRYWNFYLIVHGLWHILTAGLLVNVFVPPHSPLRGMLEWIM